MLKSIKIEQFWESWERLGMKEIDIDSIEKLILNPYKGFVSACENTETIVNQLLQAVKQLNREVTELKK